MYAPVHTTHGQEHILRQQSYTIIVRRYIAIASFMIVLRPSKFTLALQMRFAAIEPRRCPCRSWELKKLFWKDCTNRPL
jgi:hypothetical protein